MWSRSDGNGGTISYYYEDRITWVVLSLAVIWIAWLLIRRYRRARAQRRPAKGVNQRMLKQAIKIKDELSALYLGAGSSNNLHALGIGRHGTSGDYCIQFFVDDASRELWPGAGKAALPSNYRGMPLVLVQMPRASLVIAETANLPVASPSNWAPIRNYVEVTVGGISGANTNLSGQSGTIGYLCRGKSILRRRNVYLLSNSHVFVDLLRTEINNNDLIIQPSPGEVAIRKETIGKLHAYLPLRFSGPSQPNIIDAAIGKLNSGRSYQAVLPAIGAVRGYVARQDVAIGEAARKFGRTTGYTEGSVFSVNMDAWITYSANGESAFFKNQLLIAPSSPAAPEFVAPGDSGSLVVDDERYAIGLICAGPPRSRESLTHQPEQPTPPDVITIGGYGIANPIENVLNTFAIELLTE